MLKITTAQKKIAKLRRRLRIIQGSTSAGKTFSIIPLLIDYAIKHDNCEISIVSETLPHLRKGAMRDFLKIMKWTDNFINNNWERSIFTYRFNNGSYIEFFSADNYSKLHGPRRDILFLNECNNVKSEAFTQLAIRTNLFIYMDFNPTHEFYVHTDLLKRKDADFLILTYRDNEALSPEIIKELESRKELAKTSAYWRNWWLIYGEGQLGILDGVIFTNWEQIDKIPNEARLLGCGLDFGYTNHPTAIIEVYEWNGKRILNEICYQKELSNREIAKLLPDNVIIYGDGAEPKSIVEIRNYGKKIIGVAGNDKKISFGIQLMQGRNYLVTSRSLNLIKELRNYSWQKDKNGISVNIPIDNYNHCIDAVRYHEVKSLGARATSPHSKEVRAW